MGLRQAKAVSIEGHPTESFNGLYTHDSTHEGWPVLKSAKGKFCYRYTPDDEWFLSDKFTPDDSTCNAYIEARVGPLPVGAHTWKCWVNDGTEDGLWKDRMLTMTLMAEEPAAAVAQQFDKVRSIQIIPA